MPDFIPISIHGEISSKHVASDGSLRVSEKGTVEVLVPESVIEGNVLPMHHKDAGYRRVLLAVDHLGRDARSRGKVLSIPYAGWKVTGDSEASVVDSDGNTVVTYFRTDPLTSRSPKEQASAYLNDLRSNA